MAWGRRAGGRVPSWTEQQVAFGASGFWSHLCVSRQVVQAAVPGFSFFVLDVNACPPLESP